MSIPTDPQREALLKVFGDAATAYLKHHMANPDADEREQTRDILAKPMFDTDTPAHLESCAKASLWSNAMSELLAAVFEAGTKAGGFTFDHEESALDDLFDGDISGDGPQT